MQNLIIGLDIFGEEGNRFCIVTFLWSCPVACMSRPWSALMVGCSTRHRTPSFTLGEDSSMYFSQWLTRTFEDIQVLSHALLQTLCAGVWWPCTTCSTVTLAVSLILGNKGGMRRDMRCRVTDVHTLNLVYASQSLQHLPMGTPFVVTWRAPPKKTWPYAASERRFGHSRFFSGNSVKNAFPGRGSSVDEAEW